MGDAILEGHGIEYFLAPKNKWLLDDRSKYLCVIDDYVFTVKLDPNITKNIDELYTKVKSADQLNINQVLGVFQKRIKAKLVLEKNSKLAGQYKSRFEKLFGPIYKK